MSPQCAYIGLGAMGSAMAGHISDRLSELNYPSLLVFNRTIKSAERLKESKPAVVVTQTAEEIAQKADIIFSCVFDNAAALAISKTLITHLKPGAIVVEQSTISPETSRQIYETFSNAGIFYMSSPVMGPPEKAIAGELVVLMSGPQNAREAVTPILIPAIGKKHIDLGDVIEKALKLKLCGNFFVTSVVELVAEGMALGDATGIGEDNIKALINTLFPNTLFPIYAERIHQKTYHDKIAFSVNSAKKDVGYIKEMAEASNANLPITNIFLDHLNQSNGDSDLTSIVEVLKKNPESK
ncbi:NAD(P)-binding protein [Backusella circina FSU 941]|nr:NAD(P)-binding protein [Backusella circina FSU 941]